MFLLMLIWLLQNANYKANKVKAFSDQLGLTLPVRPLIHVLTNTKLFILVYDFLMYLMLLVFINIPWKHLKTSGFLMFSRGIERNHYHKMSLKYSGLILIGYPLPFKFMKRKNCRNNSLRFQLIENVDWFN